MTELKKLSDLRAGQKGRVREVKGDSAVHRRLLDMGLVKGALVEVEKVAPLGDPIEIRVRGYHLSLRKEESDNITVRVN